MLGACVPLPVQSNQCHARFLLVSSASDSSMEPQKPQKESMGLTGTGRTDQDHAHTIGRLGLASSALLDFLDTFLQGGHDIVQALDLVVYNTHVCCLRDEQKPDRGGKRRGGGRKKDETENGARGEEVRPMRALGLVD